MSQPPRLLTEQDRVVAQLLGCSGGRPIIQIVLDPDNDATSISSVGVDPAEIPAFILRLGRALTAHG